VISFVHFGAPRSVRKYNKPMWMKVPYHPICRTGESSCDNNEGNNIIKAHNERVDKLHQLSLVTQLVVVKLSEMMKPATLLEETVKSTARATRGKMMLRVSQRLRMNVGSPNAANVQCWRGSRRCP